MLRSSDSRTRSAARSRGYAIEEEKPLTSSPALRELGTAAPAAQERHQLPGAVLSGQVARHLDHEVGAVRDHDHAAPAQRLQEAVGPAAEVVPPLRRHLLQEQRHPGGPGLDAAAGAPDAGRAQLVAQLLDLAAGVAQVAVQLGDALAHAL